MGNFIVCQVAGWTRSKPVHGPLFRHNLIFDKPYSFSTPFCLHVSSVYLLLFVPTPFLLDILSFCLFILLLVAFFLFFSFFFITPPTNFSFSNDFFHTYSLKISHFQLSFILLDLLYYLWKKINWIPLTNTYKQLCSLTPICVHVSLKKKEMPCIEKSDIKGMGRCCGICSK